MEMFSRPVAETACAIIDTLTDALATRSRPDTYQVEPFEAAVGRWCDDIAGRSALRHFALMAAPWIEQVWDGLTQDQRDHIVWDFEFVPAILALYDFDKATASGTFPEPPNLMEAIVTAQGLAAPKTDISLAKLAPGDMRGFPTTGRDRVTNATRADMGARAVAVMVEAWGGSGDTRSDIRDLVSNLCHLHARDCPEDDISTTLEGGHSVYEEECRDEDDEPTTTYLVIAVYADDNDRFAESYEARTPEEAERMAMTAKGGNLIIAGVVNPEGQVVA